MPATTDRPAWRNEALAGLLAAVLALPQGLAFAALAGVPPAWGLNTAIVAGLVAALAGSSRQVLTGPTNALSLALAASLAPLAALGSAEYLRLVLVVTLLVGVVQLAVGLLRLGTLTHFIAPSVLLGWSYAQPLLASPLPPVQGAAVAVGGLTLVLALVLRRLWPRGPTLLLALVAATLTSLVVPGHEALARVGTLPAAWPPFALPDLALGEIERLLPVALALTIVALGQSVAIAKALAQRSGDVLDVNRECVGQGLANVAGSMFSSFAACGSLNRSIPFVEAGGRTRRGGVMAALALLALVALAAPAIAWLPMAAISGVLLVVAIALVDRPGWRELWRLDRREAVVAAGTALAMLVLPLEQAVLAGVAASLLLYLYRTAHPALRTMGFARPPSPAQAGEAPARPFVVLEPGAPECPQLKLLRMEGSVWFGAAAHVADHLRALRDGPAPPRHLLVMGRRPVLPPAATRGAGGLAPERLRRQAGRRPPVRRQAQRHRRHRAAARSGDLRALPGAGVRGVHRAARAARVNGLRPGPPA